MLEDSDKAKHHARCELHDGQWNKIKNKKKSYGPQRDHGGLPR
ncbi:hypothetical protein AB4Y63_12190 [Leifsonia sp. YAF41]